MSYYTSTNYTTTATTWKSGTASSSGTWRITDTTPWLENPSNQRMNFIPRELQNDVEPIQGEPKGAKYLVSYMFKEPKDPVVFLKNEKDMKALVIALLMRGGR